MANSISSRKRVRQAAKRNARNRWRLRAMRNAIRSFLDKVSHGTNEEAVTAYRACARSIDRTAQRGVIHKNQAARRKSRLNAALKTKVLARKSA